MYEIRNKIVCRDLVCRDRGLMFSYKRLLASLFLAGLSLDCIAQDAHGGYRVDGWQITPRLSIGTTYSDNIRLVPDDTESDAVFQVDPGISLRKKGGRLNLRLDYTAQSLFYNNNSDSNQVNNNLLTFGTAELYQDHLFLDGYGSISQAAVASNGRVDVGDLGALSNLGLFGNIALNVLPMASDILSPIDIFSDIALTDNQTTESTFGISPYWRQDINNWVEVLLRYRYEDVSYSGTDSPDQESNKLSDSQINSVDFDLNSGRNFDALNWSLKYFYLKQDSQKNNDTEDDEDNRQEKIVGRSDYRLNKSWMLVAESGYIDNKSTTFSDYDNGFYWGLGATWKPSYHYSLTGLYGLNYNSIALQWNPSSRTNLAINRSYQGVGYSPGVYWNGSFNHRTRFSVWSASYTQEVTTSQQLASNTLTEVGSDGQSIVLNDQGGTASNSVLGLSNEQFMRKYFNLSATYLRGRTGLTLSGFSENREFEDSLQNEKSYGVGTLWTWRFAPRTASFLGAGWGHDDLSADQQNDYWLSLIGLAQIFSPDMGGLISYRRYQNDADSTDKGFRENRVNVRFSIKF